MKTSPAWRASKKQLWWRAPYRRLPTARPVPCFEALEERMPLSATTQGADFSLVANDEPDVAMVNKAIVAGDPNGSPVDSPANRVDPNTTNSDFGGVGSLFMDLGGGTGFLCTGTLISQKHVLTAGHCLDVDDNGSADFAPQDVSFFLNYGSNFSHTLTASALHVNPDFSGFANPSVLDDLAVVELSSAAPAGVPIYEINTAPFVNIETTTLVGYGTTGDGVNGYISGSATFTVKRTGMNHADVFLSDDEGTGTREGFEWDFDGDHIRSNVFGAPQAFNLTLGNDVETTVGGGDSGGPSFIDDGNGGLLLFGVNTFTATQKAPAPLFGSVGGGIVVSTYADWIDSFTATVPATVVGRQIFYNNSSFDGNTPGASPSDASAIATDKSAYLPGGGAFTPANATNYSKGINGIIVELTGVHGTITVDDFTVRMSEQLLAANNTPSSWVAAPAPSVTVFVDTPVAGTDRIELIWADGAITDRYLEVIVEGDDTEGGNNTNTGLAASDIFFYANKIADDFLGFPGFFSTDATDEIDARNNEGIAFSPTNAFDYNKDFFVDATDQIIARNNQGFMGALNLSSPPAAPQTALASASEIRSGLDVVWTRSIPNLPGPPESPSSIPARAWTTETSSGPIIRVFQPLQEADRPRALAHFEATDEVVESLDLDDALLDRLVATLLS